MSYFDRLRPLPLPRVGPKKPLMPLPKSGLLQVSKDDLRQPTPRKLALQKQIEGLERQLHDALTKLERKKCLVCHERECDVVLIPCYHLCMCKQCYDELHLLVWRESNIEAYLRNNDKPSKCPLCRVDIRARMNVFVN